MEAPSQDSKDKTLAQPSGTITVNLDTMDPRLANRIVRLLNKKETVHLRRVKVKQEIDLETRDVKSMLDLAEENGPREYCLIGFLAIGLREAEVVGADDPRVPLERRLPGLRVEDFRFKDGTVWVHGKGLTYKDRDGTIKQDATKIVLYPVPPRLGEEAGALAKEVKHGGIITGIGTRTVDRIVERYAKLAGVSDYQLLHPHRLRHWFEEACRPLCQDGFELADMMRHTKKGAGPSSSGGFYARTIPTPRRREILLQATSPLFKAQ